MSSANTDSFISLQPPCLFSYFFFYLIVVARTSSTVLIRVVRADGLTQSQAQVEHIRSFSDRHISCGLCVYAV